jgi:RNA polymerase sigma-70 factor (family 1)
LDTNQSYDEKELLSRIAKGDEQAFGIFFNLYKDRFYFLVLKTTRSDVIAEEIVQDIFLKLWQKREMLVDIENPSSYFFTAVYRRIYIYFRKLALDKKILKVVCREEVTQNTTEEMVIFRESERYIKEAIAKLPPQQQLVYKLSKQDGYSREQIANELKISPHTVKNHLADALKFIRGYLQNFIFIVFLLYWFLKK